MKKYRVLKNHLAVPEGIIVYKTYQENVHRNTVSIKEVGKEMKFDYFIYPKFLEEIK